MNDKFTSLSHITFGLLFGCLSLGLLMGCASTSPQPAIVANRVIKNSTVGFKGYEVAIPSGYEVCDPSQQSPTDSPLIAALKKDFGKEALGCIATDKRIEFVETFLLTNSDSALVFSVATGRLPFSFSQIPVSRKFEIHQKLATQMAKEDPDFSGTKIDTVGYRYVVDCHLVESFDPSDPNRTPLESNAYMVLGNKNEIFIFAGVTRKGNGSRMVLILKQMIQDLKL